MGTMTLILTLIHLKHSHNKKILLYLLQELQNHLQHGKKKKDLITAVLLNTEDHFIEKHKHLPLEKRLIKVT